MVEATEAKDIYCARFAQFEKEAARNGGSWIYPVRKAAISCFAEQGFPTTRHEEWKYTSVAPIVTIPFEPAGYELNGLTLGKAEPLAFGGWEGSQLVFVNGHYAPELSSLRPLPGGVKAGSLEAAFSTDTEWVEPHLARYASYQDHAFVALNTAFMADGAFLYVPKGKIVEEPIHLLFLSTAHEQATVSHPRNLIVVGQDSRATIVESYVGIGEGVYFTNAVTEIVSAENAVIDHYKLQRESPAAFHIGILQAHLDRSSHFTSHSIALGGALVRNEINAVLDGEGGECTLNGLYLVTGEQHVDNHTQMAHAKAHCTSRELYKGILGGKARGVFNGKIVVHKSASKTDAKQTNNNLLLSRDASVDTKPQLEINNNDVKCTHGSTIGRLDQDQIFYLRSRGIDPEGAMSLLMYAFASEVINRIKIERIRSELDRMLMARLQKKHLSREGL